MLEVDTLQAMTVSTVLASAFWPRFRGAGPPVQLGVRRCATCLQTTKIGALALLGGRVFGRAEAMLQPLKRVQASERFSSIADPVHL